MPVTKHRHLQINIKQTMTRDKVRADVVRAFDFEPDTIVFNEATEVAHAAIRRECATRGYEALILDGSAGQVVLVWDAALFEAEFSTATLTGLGRKRVTPRRYVVRARLRVRATGRYRPLAGTHMVASGWTGKRHIDAWRQKMWYAHAAVMIPLLRRVASRPGNEVVIWSGDCNRPPSMWAAKRPFPRLTGLAGYASSFIVDTDATHYRTTFDYVGVLSRGVVVRVADWSTPSFASDHDGVLVDLEWDEPGPNPPLRRR